MEENISAPTKLLTMHNLLLGLLRLICWVHSHCLFIFLLLVYEDNSSYKEVGRKGGEESENEWEEATGGETDRRESIREDEVSAKDPALENKMYKCLECPICMEYMRPPIAQCDTGHSICGSCRSEISRCPTCNNSIGTTRNFSLEDIAQVVTYPCGNRQNGCASLMTLKNIEIHETDCEFRPYVCPFGTELKQCSSWKNHMPKFVEHVQYYHKINFFQGDLSWSRVFHNGSHHGITEYDNNVFYVVQKWDWAHIWFSVCLLGPNTNCDDYVFEFEMGVGSFNDTVVVRRGRGQTTDYTQFSNHYIKVHKNSFEDLGETGFVYFRIIKKTIV